jgi:hypothetical protein
MCSLFLSGRVLFADSFVNATNQAVLFDPIPLILRQLDWFLR